MLRKNKHYMFKYLKGKVSLCSNCNQYGIKWLDKITDLYGSICCTKCNSKYYLAVQYISISYLLFIFGCLSLIFIQYHFQYQNNLWTTFLNLLIIYLFCILVLIFAPITNKKLKNSTIQNNKLRDIFYIMLISCLFTFLS